MVLLMNNTAKLFIDDDMNPQIQEIKAVMKNNRDKFMHIRYLADLALIGILLYWYSGDVDIAVEALMNSPYAAYKQAGAF